jgi:predicted lysophospholipase L1 biosynthesis ABC-type transport system permease subunit
MKNIQIIADKAAITLSVACTLQCLALPLLAVFLPTAMALYLGDEQFHLWMLVVVVPVSLFGLTIGCRKHRDLRIMLLGVFGLAILVLTALFGHEALGEIGEKTTTTLGACLIAAGHILNHRLCQNMKCKCES